MRTKVKTRAEVEAMRTSGAMLAAVLRKVATETAPEMTTKALADIAAKELKALGGKSAFLGHEGFPDVICISINDEIVHGIPSTKRVLQGGDLVGLDFGVKYNGLLTDGAISVVVGRPAKPAIQKLLDVTRLSLEAGIAAVHDRVRVGDISAAIEETIRGYGSYGIPTELVGHGVGSYLWEEPNIPNCGRKNTGPWLEKGMTIAIEPMVTLGTDKIRLKDDGWTIATADGSWSAHFEHTVLITDEGAEILTK